MSTPFKPRILAVDSASPYFTLALCEGKDALYELQVKARQKDGPGLLSLINQGLLYLDWKIQHIDRFVIGQGPGAFTGLRVSMALLKAFSLSLNKPLYALSSLDAMAYDARHFNGLVLAGLDARRSELYLKLYRGTQGQLRAVSEALLLPPSALGECLSQEKDSTPILALGAVFKQYLEAFGPIAAQLQCPELPTWPRAAALAALSLERYPLGQAFELNLTNIEPSYIRPNDFALPKAFDFSKPEQFRKSHKTKAEN